MGGHRRLHLREVVACPRCRNGLLSRISPAVTEMKVDHDPQSQCSCPARLHQHIVGVVPARCRVDPYTETDSIYVTVFLEQCHQLCRHTVPVGEGQSFALHLGHPAYVRTSGECAGSGRCLFRLPGGGHGTVFFVAGCLHACDEQQQGNHIKKLLLHFIVV